MVGVLLERRTQRYDWRVPNACIYAETNDCSPGRLRRGICERHYRRVMKNGRYTPPQYGWRHKYRINEQTGCWIWTGKIGSSGYGLYRGEMVHRYVYREMVGSFHPALAIDHLCLVRLCINPKHLEPVTWAENNRRKMMLRKVCARGHDLALPGALFPGTFRCWQCRKDKMKRANAKRYSTPLPPSAALRA